jgi:dihydropyrimidine dehydrogenase (NAD+) subunit PreA
MCCPEKRNKGVQIMNLHSEFCGLALENPFLLASAPPTASIEMIDRALKAGWAGVVTKTIKPDYMEIKDARPRFHAVKEGSRVIGFENFELVSKKDLNYWQEGIEFLRHKWPEKIIIVSIMGDSNEKSWADLAIWAQNSGAHALELNFSCPHGMPEKGVGAAIGQNAQFTGIITEWVVKSVSIPVIVKLTPNVTSVVDIAQAAAKGGASALAAINTVESLSGVDLKSLTPLPNVQGVSTLGGYSGPAVKPIGLRVISQLAKETDLPLSGMGGISNWYDAMEYISLGANHVQVCTQVMVDGFKIIEDLLAGTINYMEEMGFSSLDDFRGAALEKITSHQALNKTSDLVPVVNNEFCTKCGKCVISCRDGGYQAISFTNKKIVINAEKCDGCGLCTFVCPESAINFPEDEQENPVENEKILQEINI